MPRPKRRGTPRPTAGRPSAAGAPRTLQVAIRALPEERQAWLDRAHAAGVSMGEWIRRVLAAAL